MKQRLLNGEMIELENESNSVFLWFNQKTSNFVLELNAKVIKATKTWKPIELKLQSINNLNEKI
jgi:hypothetical protein